MILPRLRAVAVALVALVLATSGCGHSARPSGPAGWQPEGTGGLRWSFGTGAESQTFRIESQPFDGGLHELASEEAAAVILHHPGLRYVGSIPFPPCPGEAGLLRFVGHGASAQRIEVGFTVWQGTATIATYARPLHASVSREAWNALRADLCHTVA